MKTLNLNSLATYKADRGLANGRKLTVGILRIASIPDVVRPDRTGTIQPDWLSPMVLSISGK
jgi:hypothetical protein